MELKKQSEEAQTYTLQKVVYKFNWANTRLPEVSRTPITFKDIRELNLYVRNLAEKNAEFVRSSRKEHKEYYLMEVLQK